MTVPAFADWACDVPGLYRKLEGEPEQIRFLPGHVSLCSGPPLHPNGSATTGQFGFLTLCRVSPKRTACRTTRLSTASRDFPQSSDLLTTSRPRQPYVSAAVAHLTPY